MQELDHYNIIKLQYVYETQTSIYLILDVKIILNFFIL